MKLLYGIQTTGNGHICRSRLMVEALKTQGHSVTALFSGHGRASFWDYNAFQPFNELRGLTFVTQKGQINYTRTLMDAKPRELLKDIRELDLSEFDAVISDFEPISAWAAKRQNIPSIGISNQEAFYYNIPKCNGNPMARLIMRHFAPTRHHIGLHWHHFDQPILPPIIETSLQPIISTAQPMILVYLPFENTAHIKQQLSVFTEHTFHVYTDVAQVQQFGHIILHPFNRDGFMSDLQRCTGVICQAGFELPSEALHLGKKLLVKPMKRQYEQMSNVAALTQYGLGRSMQQLNHTDIEHFLAMPSIAAKNYPNVATAIAQWIGQADLDAPLAHQSLVEQLWTR